MESLKPNSLNTFWFNNRDLKVYFFMVQISLIKEKESALSCYHGVSNWLMNWLTHSTFLSPTYKKLLSLVELDLPGKDIATLMIFSFLIPAY